MPRYEFQSMLFRNSASMLNSVASEWLTAGGANGSDVVAEFLAECSDEQLAAECIKGWGLDQGDDLDPEVPSHMQRDEYTAEDLAAAFARFRAEQAQQAEG